MDIPQELPSINIPPNPKRKLPAAKDGISGLELEVRFSRAASEIAGRNVANVIDEVGARGADRERDRELGNGGG